MKNYALKRLLQLIPILLAITFLSYGMMRIAGSDVVEQKMENTSGTVSQEMIDNARAELGLDKPFVVQYFTWLGNLLRGDMGTSYVSNKPVFSTFVSKLPATLLLTAVSILLTVLISIPLGIWSAVKQNTATDYVIRTASFIGNSLPNFFVSLLLMYFFAIRLGWFPVISGGVSLQSVALPALTLAAYMYALLTPAVTYDFGLKAKTEQFLWDFDDYFGELTAFKALFNQLMRVREVKVSGFTPAVIALLGNEAENERFRRTLCREANANLTVNTPKTRMKALPILYNSEFGIGSDLYQCMEIIAQGSLQEIINLTEEGVETVLSEYCEAEDGEYRIAEHKVDDRLNRAWDDANPKTRFRLEYDARDLALRQYRQRLEIMVRWVEHIRSGLLEATGRSIEVMIYGDGAFKDPVGKIWELADPVVSPAYTPGLEGQPNEVKLKYLADNDFAHLSGNALKAAISDYIRNKEDDLTGQMVSQGTTPRRLTDLIGSLCDLTSGSGDKGTPIVLVQGYFDNYTK